MFQIGDLVRFIHKPKPELNNFFGIVYEINRSFINPKLMYYHVRWLDTGDSFGYEESEIEKVSLSNV
jgi:hypothetical protein